MTRLFALTVVVLGSLTTPATAAPAHAKAAQKSMEVIRHAGSCHGYLAIDPGSSHAVLVDAPSGAARRFLPEIAKRGLAVSAILLTHDHGDHVVDLKALHEGTGARIVYGAAMPGVAAFAHAIDGAIVKAGTLRFEVLHLPGHSDDSLGFHEAQHGHFFAGDTLQAGVGGGRFSDPNFLVSMRRLTLLPHDTKLHAGHGAPSTIGNEVGWMTSVLETEAPELLR